MSKDPECPKCKKTKLQLRHGLCCPTYIHCPECQWTSGHLKTEKELKDKVQTLSK